MTLGLIGAVIALIPILAGAGLICGVLAIVFGFIGRSNVRENPRRPGKGMATAGIVLGIVTVAFALIAFVIMEYAFG